MTRIPPPEAAVLSGPLGHHDPHAERLRDVQRTRMAAQTRAARRWQRWSDRLTRLAEARSEAVAILRARKVS
ncbi:hypothetical protein [Phytoactinopolyspora endophytica]|uniref:hypothetical protein n=1 Tax=Phytoactinopolyspora endophytica TaxID=1642495 RepID=UPI00101BEB3D|nr:hypothetical protein [Phytoactinopolyspora endophytica]